MTLVDDPLAREARSPCLLSTSVDVGSPHDSSRALACSDSSAFPSTTDPSVTSVNAIPASFRRARCRSSPGAKYTGFSSRSIQ